MAYLSPMTVPLRSKQGCWTCRLRKKKCDEDHPLCSMCTSLSITCYGYGPKPTWMNDPEQERAVANSIKEIVKHTSRQKSVRQSSRPQASTPLVLAPKPLNVSEGILSIYGSDTNRQNDSRNASHLPLNEIGGRPALLQDGLSVSMSTLYYTRLGLIPARVLFWSNLGREMPINQTSPVQ